MKTNNWLVVSTPLIIMKVSWDHYSQYMEKNVPNHQPDKQWACLDMGYCFSKKG
jgi:hypothetical protein